MIPSPLAFPQMTWLSPKDCFGYKVHCGFAKVCNQELEVARSRFPRTMANPGGGSQNLPFSPGCLQPDELMRSSSKKLGFDARFQEHFECQPSFESQGAQLRPDEQTMFFVDATDWIHHQSSLSNWLLDEPWKSSTCWCVLKVFDAHHTTLILLAFQTCGQTH